MSDLQPLRELFETSRASVSFTARPEPIAGDLRISWRLVMLCLLLSRSHGGKASLQAAHVLWWAVRTDRTRTMFLRWIAGEQSPDEFLVRFDPALTQTTDLAVGAGLVTVDHNANLSLTAEGRTLAESAFALEGALEEEKRFLSALPRRITQRSIRELLEWK